MIYNDNIKTELLNAGLHLTDDDFGTHESDLYVLSRPGVVNWLKTNYQWWCNVTEFVGAAGTDWAGKIVLDLPFANTRYFDRIPGDRVTK